jgi:D-amino peptidase
MKIMISADMEGTCGVSSWVHVEAPEAAAGAPASTVEYEKFRLLMTKEVNAAVEGALAGGADEVIVNDSHDGQRNLVGEALHPSVRYTSGGDKPLGMMQGVDLDGISAVFYTGYHAKAGTPNGPLAHCWTTTLHDVRFDGVSTGEFGINAAVAGYYGVPVVFVSGDDQAVAQTREFVGDQVVGVAVKQGISSTAALHLHPERARTAIREGAERAVRAVADAKPYVIGNPTRVELDFDHQSRADQCELWPDVERIGPRSIAFSVGDGRELIRTFRGIMKLAAIRLTP